MGRIRREAVLDVYQLVSATFLFVSPWLFTFTNAASSTDDRISAVLVGASSFAALIIFREWEEWVNLILGLWILVSPWILNFHVAAATHVNVAVGVLITYIALLELWLIYYGTPEHFRA